MFDFLGKYNHQDDFLDFRFDIFMRMERLSFMSDDGNCFVIFDETDVSIPILNRFHHR